MDTRKVWRELEDIKALKTKAEWRQEPEDLISGEKSNYHELERKVFPDLCFHVFSLAIALFCLKLIAVAACLSWIPLKTNLLLAFRATETWNVGRAVKFLAYKFYYRNLKTTKEKTKTINSKFHHLGRSPSLSLFIWIINCCFSLHGTWQRMTAEF